MFPLLLHDPTLQFARLPRHGGPHTFLQQFEFSNSLHTELLQQIRFGESGGRLSFQGSDSGARVDIIAVTITAILATTASTVEQQPSS